MDGLDFSLRGFVVCYLLTYAAGILFAVLEGRRWNAAARTVPPAVVLIVFAPLIFPVVAHLVRPRLRARGVDPRIVRLKLAIAWFVPVLAAAGLWLCGFFCNAVVDAAFSEELAACCGLSCVFLSMISTIWVSARLDALALADAAQRGR